MCSLCRKTYLEANLKLVSWCEQTLKPHPATTYDFFSIVYHDIREIQALLVWQTLRCQAEQESSNETTCDNDIFLHKLCGPFNKCVKLWACLVGSLL